MWRTNELNHIPDAKDAVACSGDDLSIASDFSAALRGVSMMKPYVQFFVLHVFLDVFS
jgi:hypothetical protein